MDSSCNVSELITCYNNSMFHAISGCSIEACSNLVDCRDNYLFTVCSFYGFNLQTEIIVIIGNAFI